MELKDFRISLLLLVAGVSACGGGSGEDPLVSSFPIAYVVRPFPVVDDDGEIIQPDARNPLQFYPGSDLYIRSHASAQAAPRNITGSITGGTGDVRDVDVSHDGKKLIFSVKLEPDTPNMLPRGDQLWKIWEYDIETGSLTKISRDIAVLAQDIGPSYLPDGRIVFSSTRQVGSRGVLVNEGKPAYTSLVNQQNNDHAMMLHVMDGNGRNVEQITFGLGRDMDPFVAQDGRIVFTRWDRYLNENDINLYSVNPDGTNLQLMFGAHSHEDGPTGNQQFVQPKAYPGTDQVLTIQMPHTNTFGGGDLVLVDINRFGDVNRATFAGGSSGSGVSSITGASASSRERPTMGGRFISAHPLWDGSGRSLVSWTPCRLLDGTNPIPCTEGNLGSLPEAPPVYNLYVYNPSDNSKLPVFLPSAGNIITDVVAIQARSFPPMLESDPPLDPSKQAGELHIHSVYDYDGIQFQQRGTNVAINDQLNPIPEYVANTDTSRGSRAARFIRLIKPFVNPDRGDFRIPNNASLGGRGLVEIIGYAPIAPDGSVYVSVPANVPFSFQILDVDGRRIGEPQHNYWLTVRNGEKLECGGCHSHGSGTPHGRVDAVPILNRGSTADLSPFPGQNSAFVAARQGDTMAETWVNNKCGGTEPADRERCNEFNPTVNLAYTDEWPNVLDQDVNREFEYSYARVYDYDVSEPSPIEQSCMSLWRPRDCRVLINYEDHIEPLWHKPRTNESRVADTNVTCSQNGCHSSMDTAFNPATMMDENIQQIPEPRAGSQINLVDGNNNDVRDDVTRLKSYQELLVQDVAKELVGTDIFDFILTDVVVDLVSVNTNPGPPIGIGSANGSPRFFDIFSATRADPIHYDATTQQGILSPHELKLISEWIDIGAQYMNDPR